MDTPVSSYPPSSHHDMLSLQSLHLSPDHHRYRLPLHHSSSSLGLAAPPYPTYPPTLHRLQTDTSLHDGSAFSPEDHHHGRHDHRSGPSDPHSPIQGPFSSILTSGVAHQSHVMSHYHQDDDVFMSPTSAVASSSADESSSRAHGQLVNNMVIDPPDLEAWRERLFHVDETIVLTNEQFETYFPHIDNVYSHRSTQKYKRKPFVSHYWDCRMKGRPPGTPKSNDPSKKKRKRQARERDLCDVKIKITEYFPGATLQLDDKFSYESASPAGVYPSLQQLPPTGERFWTIQRVNGNGGNGKGDGVAGPHKHTLAKSDEIKKSSVQRYLAAQEKEAKKSRKSSNVKPTGPASSTAKKHSKNHPLKLYAGAFCPFSHRVWIALEVKGLQYQYIETDPFRRPSQLLEANPRGLVPAVREGEWATGESGIILEYLEEFNPQVPLYPTDPRLKANCRLWIDFVNSKIVPNFFSLVKAEDLASQTEYIERLQSDVTALVQAADERGPYFLGADLCLVDIHFAPFVLRMSRVLREFRHWSDPMPGTRWQLWVEALERNPHIRATTSNDELYLETFDVLVNTQMSYSEYL